MTTYTANNSVPMPALPTTLGVKQEFIVDATSNGPSTYAPDGLAAAPILGLGGQQLQGDEIVAGGIATLVSYLGPLMNSGALCWVLISCDGGAVQVAPAVASEQAVQLQQIGHGQCRLSVTDSSTLTLSPYNGENVLVGGVPLQLPSSGVAISNLSLAASTIYFVYLAGTTATPALVLSITGHITGPSGVEVMNGDVTKTLVGMISTNSASQFVDSVSQRFCLNWFNRRNLACNSESAPTITFSNTIVANIDPSLDLTWLTWGDESTFAAASGGIANSVAESISGMQLNIDGTSAGARISVTASVANASGGYCSMTTQPFSEGLHTTHIFGVVTGGTASCNCQVDTMIRG